MTKGEGVKMKETGLIFSKDMALANIEGRKTMTRRLRGLEKINENPDNWAEVYHVRENVYRFVSVPHNPPANVKGVDFEYQTMDVKCPFGGVGDKIWQRETWATEKNLDYLKPSEMGQAANVPLWFKADDSQRSLLEWGKWRPSIFMCRWMSRFKAPINELVAERLQDISTEDCIAEGFASYLREHDAEVELKQIFITEFLRINHLPEGANPWLWGVRYKNTARTLQ